ncbi:MAG TPA: HoxN/HupN/NixA family nickel/cobalt transporter [Actinocrinis sp.]|uniref:HoxN/HupN/NixA family nickel/cobalt transporter n=1 Tax=Actinocrinis sp. TaxID=1920516 RepID=UPI002DDCDC93|nr:HoxN/HupN/NixA family nickel/cobalt transporter [Actinocrinis sp.]HEV2345576.1 HoxN/HupN/NixA family nickel/cobalt transporter [Actinocrinis sp.]
MTPTITLARARSALRPGEWYRLSGMAGFILLLHVVGWGIVASIASSHYRLGSTAFGVGTGLTAYTLGMRHAFDADHIAAIDNTTRKLMSQAEMSEAQMPQSKRPLSVGFWFSLGHSSVVFGLSLLLAMGVKALVGPVKDGNAPLHHYAGLIGTTVSGGFLYVIAAVNAVIFWGILKVFRAMRRGEFDETALEEHLNNRGLLNRILGRVMRAIRKPWQMYPVGLLFGLGFDTATEVAFLVLASSTALAGLPWYAILSLPVLFAAGMSLLDTIDGSFMNFAYGWAFANPVRKVYYNLTITGLSVAVALIVGTVELLGLLAQQLNFTGAFWTWIAGLNLNTVGFVIVGLFVATWVVALAVWRFGRIEERWRTES